jgi:predicted XRE-type DNA-binding protein
MKKNPSRTKKFPDAATLKKVRDKFSALTYQGGNIALADDATEVERAKYQICQLIARFRREHEMTQRELANLIGIDESRISDLLRAKLGGFTLDRLLGYAQKLYPRVKVQIRAA